MSIVLVREKNIMTEGSQLQKEEAQQEEEGLTNSRGSSQNQAKYETPYTFKRKNEQKFVSYFSPLLSCVAMKTQTAPKMRG